MNRRNFLIGLLAALIIVRSGILMPVRPLAAYPTWFGVIDKNPFVVDSAFQIEQFAKRIIEPAMLQLEKQLAADLDREYWKPDVFGLLA